jgi:hypothetical protein
MKLTAADKKYSDQSSLAGTLYECEPQGFGDLVSQEELKALSNYYFMDREVDVEDIYAYRKQLLLSQPELVSRAEQALKKVAKAYKIDDLTIEKLFL